MAAENSSALGSVLTEFERKTGLHSVQHEFKQRHDGTTLVIRLANPTERFFGILEDVNTHTLGEERNGLWATLKKKAQPNLLQSPEGRHLLRTLSESLTVDRHSFGDDFFSRYTKSVSAAEVQITAAANHIVYGRRGAGKSSLLLYALHTRDREGLPYAWVDMQVYGHRSECSVIADVIFDVLSQLQQGSDSVTIPSALLQKVEALKKRPDTAEGDIRSVLPDVRRALGGNTATNIVVFLDDFHVVNADLQPLLLDIIYGIARGNRVHLKISAIETLTRTWNPKSHQGLQIPHDAQAIKLDYNLTVPDRATEHIQSILDAHAHFSALPSVRALCTSSDVISRLVWVSAGVPRDALSIFAQAMTKATVDGRKHVSVTNVNIAASETVSQKLRDIEHEVGEEKGQGLQSLLEEVKDFCVKQQRQNAFLVEIRGTDTTFGQILELVDLRVLHVISEGITVGAVGQKYLGLILDYGFYTGIRAAQSVDLFNKQTKRVTYKQLRKLPVLKLTSQQ